MRIWPRRAVALAMHGEKIKQKKERVERMRQINPKPSRAESTGMKRNARGMVLSEKGNLLTNGRPGLRGLCAIARNKGKANPVILREKPHGTEFESTREGLAQLDCLVITAIDPRQGRALAKPRVREESR